MRVPTVAVSVVPLMAMLLMGFIPRGNGAAPPPPEPAFAAFQAWVDERLSSPPRRPQALDIEGPRLAAKRREEMSDLIQSDPRRALALALPESLRRTLPESVTSLLEEHVEGIGDLEVLCALPEPGGTGDLRPLRRFVVLAGRRFEAFVHGRRLGEPTRRGVPLRGIAVGRFLAVEEEPEPPSLTGERLAASAATEGLKRLVFIRVDFSDLPGEPFTTNRAAELTRELHRFYQENSYGRAGFVEIGLGSAVTPVFRMPRTAADYGGNDDSGDLRRDARKAATDAGYELGGFDYDVTCLRSVPGFGWSGLGYVGAPGAWIRGTSSAGVTAHELGHNLGLNHANFWDTGGTSVTGAGESVEYGDKFDTMGAANGGNYHFNARYKRLLGWLQEGEFTVATTNGIYRIHAHDQTNTVSGSRGLQIFANAHTNYWVEFRQRFAGNRWLINGASVRWSGRGNESSLLLDTTPGSAGEKDDSAVLIGRTYSDAQAGLHLTPVAKGGSNPAWLEVFVHRGDSRTNLAPRLGVSSSLTSGTTATTFEFHAEAVDPEGDDLAYFWTFGDETLGENAPSLAHRWAAAGAYVVQCTVSDRKGGEARQSVTVRVGQPGTFQVAGRITADGEPVAGVRVTAGQDRQTFSDSDGTYRLTGLGNGSYSLAATLDEKRFEPVTFVNPIRLTADREGLDFASPDVSTRRPVTLLAAGASWRYWDRGTEPGDDWRSPGFDDTAWDAGPAILGYGGDRETTVIGYGTDANRKNITVWFRRRFAVENPASLESIRLGLLRDDGAAVYLNGEALFRDNLPGGLLTPGTLASSTVGGMAELTYFDHELPPGRLLEGTNLLAVEVHQASVTSSDTAFDLRLTAEVLEPAQPGVHLVRPRSDAVFTAPARIVMTAAVGDLDGATVREIVFRADGSVVGSADREPFTITGTFTAAGMHVLEAEAVLAKGEPLRSPPVSVLIQDPEFNPVLVPRGATWRFLDGAVPPAATWYAPEFDDVDWQQGPARLGYGEDGEFTRLDSGPDPANRFVTAWFRHAFDLAGAEGVTNLTCRLQADDGAVVYLNGLELFRERMRPGAVSPTVRAQSDVRDDAEQVFAEHVVPVSGLVDGTNLIAVEVHQSNPSSSDLGFDLELTAHRSALPGSPRLGWRLEPGRLVLSWPERFPAWRLEARPGLSPDVAWQPVDGIPTPAGEFLEKAVASPEKTLFFRLVRP